MYPVELCLHNYRTLSCMVIAGSWRNLGYSVWKRSFFLCSHAGWISQRKIVKPPGITISPFLFTFFKYTFCVLHSRDNPVPPELSRLFFYF